MKTAHIALLVAIGFVTDASSAGANDPGTESPAARYDLKIAPQPLGAAIQELARQSGSQIIFFSRLTEGLTTAGLDGSYTLPQAMELLLAGSALSFHQLSEQTFEVRSMPAAERKEVIQPPSSSQDIAAFQKGLPEILVTGTRRTLNLDVERTENDVLPYVVFEHEKIQQSGASDLQEFLKYRLPMNTLQQTYSQNVGIVFGSRTQVDLRGFGTNQTLIMIDGRRASNAVINGSLQQQDLNGIALGAVERIEVLPTSASGIYGGDATGGVINIILRRDYHGAELAVGYGDAFDGEAREVNVSLTGGFSLEDGKTSVSMSAFWSDANLLLRRERDFVQRYLNQAFANLPALWEPPALPPLAYTTNIQSTGGNLTLDDGTPLNSLYTHVPPGYAGAATDGGAALAANAGRYNFDPADSSQHTGARNGAGSSLVRSPSLESFNAMVRRDFGPRMQAFLEVAASDSTGRAVLNGISSRFTLPANAANNPFQQDIDLMLPVPSSEYTTEYLSHDRRVVAGLISTLPWGWRGELDYVWHESGSRLSGPGYFPRGSGPELVAAVSEDPDFNPLRDTNIYRLDFSPYIAELFYGPFETTTGNLTLLSGGPVGNLPGGRPSLSIRLEHREEAFGGGTFEQRPDTTPVTIYPEKSQTISSALAEVRIPVVSERNARVFAQELELQLSGRWDEYRIHGSPGQVSPDAETLTTSTSNLHSLNPTLGLRWKPVDDVMMRMSYGTGFLPPNVTQLTPLAPQVGSVPSTLLDPRRGNLPIGSIITVQTGGNPDLEPEESESWSAGVVYMPKKLEGMRLSVDFTKIDRSDRIGGHPFSVPGMIADEAVFPGRIVRGTPTPAEAAMGWAGPITFVDLTLLNIATAKTEACDLQLDYSLQSEDSGTFDFYALGTWNRFNATQTKDGEPIIDNVGFSGGVLDYKFNAGVTWRRRGLTMGWNTQYFDSYLTYPAFPVPLSASHLESRARLMEIQGSSKVDSQMYHDVFAKYRPEAGVLEGAEFILGIRNIFNTRPPRDQQSYSTYGDPRLASYQLGFKFSLD